MLTAKDLEKYHQAAKRILNAMDNSPVPISWHEMDRMALQSVIAKEYKTLGSLLTVLLSGLIALAASRKERRYAR